MGAPDPLLHPVPSGRYNNEGQSFLYLSSDQETGIIEKFDGPKIVPTGTCAIQGFEVRVLDKVLDLTQAGPNSPLLYAALVHVGALNQERFHALSWKPEYLVPRFVADVARAKGFRAMLYQTSKVFYATGLNLVVFDPKASGILPTGDLAIWERVMRNDGDEPFRSTWYEVIPRNDL